MPENYYPPEFEQEDKGKNKCIECGDYCKKEYCSAACYESSNL